MRAILSLIATGLIFLGLWLIASGFRDPAPSSSPAPRAIAAPRKNANPVIAGTALLAGGVGFLVLILRRT